MTQKTRWVIRSSNADLNGMKGPRHAMVRMVKAHGAKKVSKVVPYAPVLDQIDPAQEQYR